MKKLSLLLSTLIFLSFTACSAPGFSGKEVKKEYFTNGQIRTEFIMDDDTGQNGLFKMYGYNGELTSTVYMKNGVKNGIETWYDGHHRKIREVPYINGKKHGTMKELYPNGDIMATIPYQNSFRNGLAQTYNPDGSVNKTAMYRNGRIVN